MFATQNWYCAGRSEDLRDQPMTRKIAMKEMALFRDTSGAVQALGAMCAHRGGDLAKGRCVNGNIECPWHGWRYDGDGKCVHIPSLGSAGKIPGLAKVPAYPVHESQGLIYVWPNAEVTPDWLPAQHDFFDARYHTKGDSRLQRGNYINTLEGSIDDAHVYITHRNTIGGATSPALAPIQNIQMDDDGRGVEGAMLWPVGAKKKVSRLTRWMNKHLLGVDEDPSTHDKTFRSEITGLVVHRYRKPSGYDLVVYAFTTPVDERQTRFVAGFIDTDPNRSLIGNLLYWFSFRSVGERVFDEDEEMITNAVADKFPGGHPRPISVNSDAMGLAFRRMYADLVTEEGLEPAWPVARSN